MVYNDSQFTDELYDLTARVMASLKVLLSLNDPLNRFKVRPYVKWYANKSFG